MRQIIYSLLLLVLCAELNSCECFRLDCGSCIRETFKETVIVRYDSIQNPDLLKRIYIYQLDSSGKLIGRDSFNNRFAHNSNPKKDWEQVTLTDIDFSFGKTNDHIHFESPDIFILTLKDSLLPVRIEKITLRHEKEPGCCGCEDWFLNNIKINGKEFKTEDLPVKIK